MINCTLIDRCFIKMDNLAYIYHLTSESQKISQREHFESVITLPDARIISHK